MLEFTLNSKTFISKPNMKASVIILWISILFSGYAFAQQNPNTIEIKKTFLGTVFKQHNVNLLPRDLLEITKANPAAYAEMQAAKKNYNRGMVLGFVGGAIAAYPVVNYLSGGDNPHWVLAAIGAGVALTSIPFAIKYNKQARNAITLYNESLPPKSSQRLDLNVDFGYNTVGLRLKF